MTRFAATRAARDAEACAEYEAGEGEVMFCPDCGCPMGPVCDCENRAAIPETDRYMEREVLLAGLRVAWQRAAMTLSNGSGTYSWEKTRHLSEINDATEGIVAETARLRDLLK